MDLKQFYIKNVGPAKIQRVQQKNPGCWTYVQQNENKFQTVWVHCIICENINPNNNECWTLGMIPSQVSIDLYLSIYDRIMTNKINETENFG